MLSHFCLRNLIHGFLQKHFDFLVAELWLHRGCPCRTIPEFGSSLLCGWFDFNGSNQPTGSGGPLLFGLGSGQAINGVTQNY